MQISNMDANLNECALPSIFMLVYGVDQLQNLAIHVCGHVHVCPCMQLTTFTKDGIFLGDITPADNKWGEVSDHKCTRLCL